MYQVIGTKTQVFFEKEYTTTQILDTSETEKDIIEKCTHQIFHVKGNLFHSKYGEGKFDRIYWTIEEK